MRENGEKKLTRRKVLRNTAAGSAAIGGVSGIGAATGGDLTDEITEIDGREKRGAALTVLRSAEYRNYNEFFSSHDSIGIDRDPSVYEITDSEAATERRGIIVLFPLSVSDSVIDANLTFTLEDGEIVYSKAMISREVGDETYEITQFRSSGGEIQKTVAEATMEDGSITTTLTESSGELTTHGRNGVSCGQCQTIMRELCRVGCSAQTGLVCAGVSFVGTPLLGIGCGVAATMICTHVVVPNDCTTSDTLQHENLCEEGGFC